jgi:predicted ATP-dependent endonuclease of OLD family
MQLIKDIKIKYFRSLYNETIRNASDLNIVFGQNDSGKSNLLRALNLFFNFETIPGYSFDFDRDYSLRRRSEPTKNTDLAITVKFNAPKTFPSLQPTFSVTRYWNRGMTGLSMKSEKISGIKKRTDEKTASRCLGQMKYHYIPAIKDRDIFGSLLEELYRNISTSKRFSDSLAKFSEELRSQTDSLSEGLNRNVGVKSNLAPPVDLSKMFRSLDFDTGGNEASPLSLMMQRGDGIQVRHIPQILAFIADLGGSKKWHIWGFEEPENSLDLASTLKEADILQGHAKSGNKQLFITSHSPAFYNLEGEEVSRFFVKKQSGSNYSSKVTRIEDDTPSALMEEIPYLDSMSVSLREAKQKILELENEADELEKTISSGDKPILLVEGESDRLIIAKAWSVISSETMPFVVKEVRGTKALASFAKDDKKGLLKTGIVKAPLFCLLDNDEDGRKIAPSDRIRKKAGHWVEDRDLHWCLLSRTEEHLLWANILGLESPPCTIESCFSSELRRTAMQDGCYGFDVQFYQEYRSEKAIKESVEALQKFDINLARWQERYQLDPNCVEEERYKGYFQNDLLNDAIKRGEVVSEELDAFSIWFKSPSSAIKVPFANWISNHDGLRSEDFGPIANILLALKSKIESPDKKFAAERSTQL